ncbi:imidazole glycerol phosphate synthase subunit HisH [Owenweeksia hongkongensis]|uniref:Imidazole glycerol phosphate synthase subunit HisH n=1 Tax=Owenweeksia hongkongensis (strain DSM 17368 / CIP 108786 / JCM 12287 / NRRL B-23963 / UST20020801) TaxID=926562 RepID=G8R6H8_OWEHD|nr:imidazole glycerol phosphate synthase subunit HisH [Owenweeksia hongkongensis]AEV34441.1 imidazole glycerol phosphate synthase, glutamine amidotransferase subunit [Owenweeksia hongkongensis DSM 17368]
MKQRIAILKYNAGNSTSLNYALARLGIEAILTDDPQELLKADKVIFPGVGEASSAMKYLKIQNLDSLIPQLTQPVLGICLGMQLMCNFSEEGNTTGLKIFDTEVKRFPAKGIIPHTGWNNLSKAKSPLMDSVETGDDFYFVHSFYAATCTQTIAECDYLLPFSAALQKDNFFGAQFHPEKSGKTGERILQNFIDL